MYYCKKDLGEIYSTLWRKWPDEREQTYCCKQKFENIKSGESLNEFDENSAVLLLIWHSSKRWHKQKNFLEGDECPYERIICQDHYDRRM